MVERISYINPKGLVASKGYSHAVAVKGCHTTIYIGGKNGIGKDGSVVGKGDLKIQTGQALENIRITLADAGTDFPDIVKLTIFVVHGQDPRKGFAAFQEKWTDMSRLPAVSVIFVAGLGHPDWLVEIEAVAVIPE
jgi:enamine deaminase RidA (YjgF/YER057c/UK114 family)